MLLCGRTLGWRNQTTHHITISYDNLAARLGYGTLNSVLTDSGPTHLKVRSHSDEDGSGQTLVGYRITGPPLSATLARQLACDAEIIPAVLGGDGAVLDLGRGTRLFTYSQRHAVDRTRRSDNADRTPREPRPPDPRPSAGRLPGCVR
jgi:hypothetical protein